MALNLVLSFSLRMGELPGLTWDCIDIESESIESGRASIIDDGRRLNAQRFEEAFYSGKNEADKEAEDSVRKKKSQTGKKCCLPYIT